MNAYLFMTTRTKADAVFIEVQIVGLSFIIWDSKSHAS